MNWLALVVTLVGIYAVIAAYLWIRRPYPETITFYGPIIAIKSQRVDFFDKFKAYATFFRLYGTFGIVMVILVSALITVMLFISVRYTLIIQPEPTGIYKPQNILLLPGINEYVPSTLAVWFAFVLTIAIHEFGHAVLCRVEGIRVKSVGILIAVIPIGFFVEPDEQELEKTPSIPKMRMFGAGIANNLVIGALCFVAMILLVGAATPVSAPVIHGIYQNYSAEKAGIPPDSIIVAVNGITVGSREEVSAILNATRPGDTVTLDIDKDGTLTTHTLTLSPWPEELGPRGSGFMGVYYYDGSSVLSAARSLVSPLGLLQLISIPFDPTTGGRYLRILAFDMPEIRYYQTPFAGFWGVVHLLFWCGWINLNVGIFNAIPMVPLDGGYILKEGVDRILERRGLARYAPHVIATVSSIMLIMLFALITLPYLLHI